MFTLETVTPSQDIKMAVPGWKLVPLMVTMTEEPTEALEGVDEIRVGGPAMGKLAVKVTGPLLPFKVLALI